jgi:hypothetical protein
MIQQKKRRQPLDIGFSPGIAVIGRATPPLILDDIPGAAAGWATMATTFGQWRGLEPILYGLRTTDHAQCAIFADRKEDGFYSFKSRIQITSGVSIAETLEQFLDEDSADTITVPSWYDPSGNGRDATQGTTGAQPTIVSGGALVTENGRPTIGFGATLAFRLSTASNVTARSVFGITRFVDLNFSTWQTEANAASVTNRITSNNAANNRALVINGLGTPSIFANGAEYVAGTSVGGQRLLLDIIGTSSGNLGRIGANPAFSATATSVLNSACVILYASDQSSNRVAIRQALAAAYGITLP